MRTPPRMLRSLLAISLLLTTQAFGQSPSTGSIIERAMRDELARNVARLKLENLARPFFISYTLADVMTVEVSATLGAIVRSDEDSWRRYNVRVLVGDYHLTNENFLDMSGGGYRQTMLGTMGRLPLEDDYEAIRRALWIATDETYKDVSEEFERKKAAIERQTFQGAETSFDDFSKAPVVKRSEPPREIVFDRDQWEEIAKELSGLFRDYPDIHFSQVKVFGLHGRVYFTNSEGTRTAQPVSLVGLQVNASTQAEDGEPLTHHVVHYGRIPEDLPSLDSLRRASQRMAQELVALRTAQVFLEAYTGPVMFEGQAAAELVGQRLFGPSSGLLAFRKPIVGGPESAGLFNEAGGESLSDRIGRRILSRDLSMKATPMMNTLGGQTLIGSYLVDSEGVRPPKEIVLVEDGILKTLLSNRTPTPSVKKSNGHQRLAMGAYRSVSRALGPSIIHMTSRAGTSRPEMKEKLIELARDEGLDHGILVRTLEPPFSGAEERFDPMRIIVMGRRGSAGFSLTKPILIYLVSVASGEEELVRSAKVAGVSLSSLRRIAGSEERAFVYNTLLPTRDPESRSFAFDMGSLEELIPTSFIVPHSLIINELEVENEKRDYTPKLPTVPSPLLTKGRKPSPHLDFHEVSRSGRP